MKRITYGDGVGLLKNNRNIPIPNPRFSSKHRFITTVDGKPVEFAVGLMKLKPERMIEEVKKVMKDQDGNSVQQVTYVKATDELLPSGTTGRKYINEKGQTIPSSEIRYYMPEDVENGGEEIQQFTKTETVEVAKYLPRGSEELYLPEDQFELHPESESDAWGLWQLAKYLISSDQIATAILVPRKGWAKFGVLLIPYVDEETGEFAVIARFVREKFEFKNPLKIPQEPKEKKGKELKTGVEELF